MSPDGGEAVVEEGKNGSSVSRLVGAEDAVVIAVRRDVGLEFQWDGWEEVIAKGDIGWDGGLVGCRKRSGCK